MDSTDLAGDEPSRRRAEGRFLFLSCVIIAIAFAGYVDFRHLRGDELTEKRDIRALWEDGARIRRCENPYARTLGANPTANKKYATYFPLFYVLSAGSQLIAPSYPQYITLWRSIFFVFYAAIGLALAWPFHRRGQYLLGLFAVLFWLFNRWTLKSVELVHIDFMPIFSLLLSLLLWQKFRRTSLLLLGISLAIKQLAIFLVPLYLVWEWVDAAPPQRLGRTAQALFWIAIIPLIVSLPFIIAEPKAFVRSILFSAIRSDETFAVPAQSLDRVLAFKGLAARTPMLLLMALIYGAACARRVPRNIAALLVLAIFVNFNSIWFRQYTVWPIALLPWVAIELNESRPRNAVANLGAWP